MKGPVPDAEMAEPRVGRIVEWHADQGFGFVRDGAESWFLHIRSFAARELIPAKGDRVRFVPGRDPKGRPCAAGAVLLHRRFRAVAQRGVAQLALLVLPLLAILTLPGSAWPVIGLLLSVSAVTFACYWRDKRAAIRGGRRVPETTLHLLELAGGWPGALLAQHCLRHKSSKDAYQRVFWLVILSHQMLAFDLLILVSGLWERAVLHVYLFACL